MKGTPNHQTKQSEQRKLFSYTAEWPYQNDSDHISSARTEQRSKGDFTGFKRETLRKPIDQREGLNVKHVATSKLKRYAHPSISYHKC
jgi:hypothetical protein